MAEIRPVVWSRVEPELPEPPPRGFQEAPVSTAPPVAPPTSAARTLPAFLEPDTPAAFVWEHLDEATALLRSWQSEEGVVAHDGPLAGMSPRHAAAAFLRGLGNVADRVVERMWSDADREWAARAVDEEPPTTKRVTGAALELGRQRIEAGDIIDEGGSPDFAVRLLNRAMGPARATQALRPERASLFERLNSLPPDQLAPVISHEHPQTIALVLSQLDPPQAGGVLAHFPERLQADVGYRLATLDEVPADALWHLGDAMAQTFAAVLSAKEHVGGPAALAQALNYSGSSVEKNVLEQIDAQHKEIAEATREQMFTFADIVRMYDWDLRTLQAELDLRDQAIVLKAANEELKDKWLDNLSEEQRRELPETMEYLGPMRLGDVQEAQRRVVALVRQLEEQGKVVIVRGEAGPYGTFV